jgi:chemotaxis protein CheD
MERLIRVGLAESHVAVDSGVVLACYGLGSCVGVALYCPVTRVGALAHVMLPTCTLAQPPYKKAKYADSAIPEMLEHMERIGARRRLVVAKIAGGAKMFTTPGLQNRQGDAGSRLMVGERNVEAVRSTLMRLKINLVGEDTGGDYGRTIRFSLSDGSVSVSSIRHGERKL